MKFSRQSAPRLSLPKGWPASIQSSILHVISLAQFAAVYTRSWAANSTNQRVRLKAELDRAREQIALLEDEIRIKDARMARIPASHRSR